MPKYQKLSDPQLRMARKFSDNSDSLTISQAVKYLNECFQLAKGEITEEQFTEKTGHDPHTLRF